MPRLDSLLHYRIVDVSTVKELARRWFREEYYQALRLKTASHRAMPDILESIKELKFYREQDIHCKRVQQSKQSRSKYVYLTNFAACGSV
ncbi:hypothetical protein MRX96_030593 [Rhipicephalus microplus]